MKYGLRLLLRGWLDWLPALLLCRGWLARPPPHACGDTRGVHVLQLYADGSFIFHNVNCISQCDHRDFPPPAPLHADARDPRICHLAGRCRDHGTAASSLTHTCQLQPLQTEPLRPRRAPAILRARLSRCRAVRDRGAAL
eukprot:COSAG01_NODE_33176_length_568_cov_23.970149_1_plen_139_part_10